MGMGIAETYLDIRGAAKRAVADLDNMKFILEHTDAKIKELSEQMDAGDQGGRSDSAIKDLLDRMDDDDHDRYYGYWADDGKIFGQSEKDITRVMRYRHAREYMDWFGPAWEKMNEADRYLLHASIVEEATCEEICDHLGIKEDAYYQRRKRAVDKLARLLYGQ